MVWPSSNPVAREMDDFWKEAQSLMQQWWYEADLDTKMMTGQQDYWNTFYNINYRNQKILMFNKILRLVNMIEGYQRKNRLASVVYPSDNDPDTGVTAEQLTKVVNWCARQDNTYEKISECFGGAVTCGLNLLQVWMDFREDPENGDIKTDRIPFNAFLTDPYWTKSDLSDCDRVWTRRYLTRRQLVSLYPSIEKDINSLGKGFASKDGKFQFLAQNWYQYQQEMYAYDEYWVRDYRKSRRILDRATGETIEWKGTRDQFQMFRVFNPNIELITMQVPTIKLHVLVNQHLIYEETSPYGLDRFPFVPFICYHFPEVQNYSYRYQGIVRNIRDSQIELNRRRNRLLDVLDAQVQSGLMVKEDALVNPEDAFMQGPGKVLYFKNTANLSTDVAPIPAPPVAQGWQELIKTLDDEIMSIVGTPEEMFGQGGKAEEMSGVLFQLKMGAGLTSLQNIFDRLNQSQKSLGDITVDLIQKNFSVEKIEKILGEKPTEEFSKFWTTKYHCVIEEASLTATQRQLQFLQAMQMKQMGVPISNAYLISVSTLQGKKAIMEEMHQQAEMQKKIQQTQAEQLIQQNEVMTRSLEAKAQNDFAAANERLARGVANVALAKERTSKAVEDRAMAELDHAKAMHELQDMDDNKLYKLATFIMDLEERQRALEGEEEGDSAKQSKDLASEVDKSEAESKPSKLRQPAADHVRGNEPESSLQQSLSAGQQ